ncbi:MAG TPA: hypothetical protein VN397_01245 [Candidatus Methylomirabilis sp.]|nr:hypothetical protein [Candidatus Methylomirabilis sp.]
MTRLARLQQVTWALSSVLFGIICLFPTIAMRVDPSTEFHGIEMQATDAEYHYVARVREVMDGSRKTSNVFYAGNKDQPYLQPALPEIVIASLGSFLGIDAARAYLVAQFLFGAMVFAVMVGCFLALTGRYWWSLFGVAAYAFAGFMYSGPTTLWKIIAGTQGTLEFLTFTRTVNPGWSATLFFGALWAFSVWLRSRSRKALMVTWILTVLSFYSYIYVWTLLGTIYAVIGLREVSLKHWVRVKELAALAFGLVIGFLPYGWNMWHAAHHPLYAETSMRFGLIMNRQPVFGLATSALIVLVIVCWKKLGQMAWLVAAFAMAAVVVQNQQLITGRAIVIAHYHWYFIKPFTMILGTILVGSFVYDRWGRRHLSKIEPIWFVAPAIIVLAAIGVLYQYRSYQAALPFWREQQKTAGVLRYLRDHTRPGDVTYATGFVRDLIPIYTSGDVYWAINAYSYLSSDERARDAYFFDLWLAGVSAGEAEKTFPTSRREELSSRIHAIYYREAAHSFGAIPDDEVRRHVEAYRAFLAEPDEQKIGTYPLTYVVFASSDSTTPAASWLRAHSDEVYHDDAFETRRLRLK